MAYVIREDGREEPVVLARGETLDLGTMYRLLDCELVECVMLKDGCTMWLDEEGKLKRRRENPVATRLLAEAGGIPGDRVAGPVLVARPWEVE